MNKFWEFKNLGNDVAELYIYSEIIPWEDEEMTSSASFKKDLEKFSNARQLKIHINSPGGSVFDGISIANMIKRFKGETICYVDGLSASIASVITASCDKVIMPSNSMQMIHNALTGGFIFANAKEFRKMADDLDKISASIRQSYLSKSNGKITEEKLIELMDNETWLSAEECFEYGLCDEVISANKMVASVPSKFNGIFNNIPDNLKELLNKEGEKVEENKEVLVEEETTEEIFEESPKVIEEDEVNEETVAEEKEEAIEETQEVDPKDAEIENLKATIETITNEKLELETKLNEANEKVISLNDKVSELQPIADKYNEELEIKNKLEEENKLKEKRDYYRNRFEKLGAKTKFESEEIQILVNNCIKDNEAISKLNSILVDLVDISSTEQKSVSNRVENVSNIGSLIDVEEDITSKYGFK
ncbi:MAG TPA: Clp protease ClpP [Romboutsia timonensis]|uniref:ATP-dependent Clp protease proteolytic subunit n=1 Tax=Romboutsia timonensis TaxID=1776391 RepID=A0A921SZP8_9FIRM|nr:Clp protease ClpP [Romboutsia timonensis]